MSLIAAITKFVDREIELSKLIEYADRGFYPILYIYGPEGCGKTRLLQELVTRLYGRRDYYTIYVNALTLRGDIRDAIIGSRELIDIARHVASGYSEPLGRLIALLLPRIMKAFVERYGIKNKHVVIAIDDIAKPLGLDTIESYVKNLLDILEYLLGIGAKSVFIIATTSEGLSRDIILRHSYAHIEAIWNLPREASIELLKQLKAPREKYDEIYRVTGGNPRAIIELYYMNWSIRRWIESAIMRRVKNFLKTLSREEIEQLKDTLDDPDRFQRYTPLLKKTIDYNLVSPIDKPCLGYTPEKNIELGIGDNYAWQLPIYKDIIKQVILHKHT